MLQFSVFNDTDWLYPDSEHNTHTEIALQLPRGGHDGVQLLVDAPSHRYPYPMIRRLSNIPATAPAPWYSCIG